MVCTLMLQGLCHHFDSDGSGPQIREQMCHMGHIYQIFNMKNQFWAGLDSRPVHKKSLGPIMSNVCGHFIYVFKGKKLNYFSFHTKKMHRKKERIFFCE